MTRTASNGTQDPPRRRRQLLAGRRAERERPGRGPLRLLSALALVCLAAGCASVARVKLSERSHQVAHPAPLGVRHPLPARCATSAVVVRPSPKIAYAAVVARLAFARRLPGGAQVVGRFGRLDLNGLPIVLGVIGSTSSKGCTRGWYRVELPVVPNGSSGWVPARAVRVYTVTSRIVISLSKRRLRLYRSGRLVLQTTAGIGATATPTPVGRYFVNERYALSSADGPFGPDALGISAHSDALQHVWVEQGPIAVHGTNEPWTIGQAASHGCIRLDNQVMRQLFPLAPAGTPVIIEA
jgi:hypothetical protein